jgi:hypothetical protein
MGVSPLWRKRSYLPFCFKLPRYPEWYNETGATSSVPNKKKWKTKSNETGLVAQATDEVSSSEAWYFDSGHYKKTLI